MKLRDKLAIFMIACLLTFVGFSLIVSTSVDVLKLGKKAGNEIISNYLAEEATTAVTESPSV
ncbi:hypothetical protein ACFLT2_11230 [Acidobacteriota bacterium]